MLVAHLIDADAGEGGVLACAHAVRAAGPGVEQRVLVLGAGWVAARAEQLGLANHRVVPMGGRSTAVHARAVRHALRGLGRTVDAVQAWSLAAAQVGVRAGLGARLVVCGATPRSAPWLADVTVARWGWQDEHAWREAGAVDVRELPEPALAPAWDAQADGYARVREDLEIEPEDEVIALLCDPPADGDARRFVYLLGLLHVGGRRIVGLVPEGCFALDRAARYTRAHGRRWGLIAVQGPMVRALAGADLAALDEARPDGAALLGSVARRMNVPVVSIGPGPAAPEVARRTAQLAIEALDRRGERVRAGTEDAADGTGFEGVLEEIWKDAAGALHVRPR